jgi:hypothetical protein
VFKNPGFEQGTSDWNWLLNNSGYYLYNGVSDSAGTDMPTEGSQYLYMGLWTGQYVSAGYYIPYYQALDLTGYNEILFDLAQVGEDGRWYDIIGGEVWIDGVRYFTKSGQGIFKDQAVNIAGLTGIHTVEFRCIVKKAGGSSYNQVINFDNIRLSPALTSFSGSVVSTQIAPSPFNRWRSASFKAKTPVATGISFDILPATGNEPIPGFQNVSSGVDLSGIQEFPIRLRANLATSDMTKTPALEDWTVAYLDGYTESAWSGVRQSTQDAVAPTADVVNVAPDPRNTRASAVQIRFSEPVQNFDVSDLTLGRDGGSNLLTGSEALTTSAGVLWSLDISAHVDQDGTYTLTLLPSDIVDKVGNPLVAGGDDTWSADITAPEVALSAPSQALAQSSTTVTIDFSEAVTGFSGRDLVTTNCRAINLTGFGSRYTIVVYPLKKGLFSVAVPPAVAIDWVNNPNEGAEWSATMVGTPAMPKVFDLAKNDEDAIFYGANKNDQFGSLSARGGAVAIGDFNGDRINDVLIGAEYAAGPLETSYHMGEAYVFFGDREAPSNRDVAGIAGRIPDLTIYGAAAQDNLSGAGAVLAADLNGDGCDEMILGAWHADGPQGIDAGAGYIIFGGPGLPATISLASPPAGRVVRLDGAEAGKTFYRFGESALTGDFNGDGLQDLVLGGYLENGYGGRAYIIFGRTSGWPASINLAVMEAGITRITEAPGAVNKGWLTAYGAMETGDFNGDGKTDLLVGAPKGWGPGDASRAECGRLYMLMGRATWPQDINLRTPGAVDSVMYGAASNQNLGRYSTMVLSDIDHDQKDDLLVYASGAGGAGATYVLYGRSVAPESIDLATTTCDSVIRGVDANDNLLIREYMPPADYNGDGRMDLLLNSWTANGPGNLRAGSGEAYLLLNSGDRLPASVDLSSPPPGTTVIYGPAVGAFLEQATNGDYNHDGISDMVLKSIGHDRGELANTGAAYILYGRSEWPAVWDLALTPADLTILGASQMDSMPHAVRTGDLNGDDVDDLFLTSADADGPDDSRGDYTGEGYVILGGNFSNHVSRINDWSLY